MTIEPYIIIVVLLLESILDIRRDANHKKCAANYPQRLEPHLKKLVFILLLTLFVIATSYGVPNSATNDMEVYIDIPLYLNLNLSSSELNFGELDEAGESQSIDVFIRANIKSWKITAKATYASLTWGAATGETWVAPTPGATLIQIPYKVSFADNNPYQILFPQAALPVNVENLLYTFTRRTVAGEGVGDYANSEKFIFTVKVDPKGASAIWQSGEYQDIILLTVTTQ